MSLARMIDQLRTRRRRTASRRPVLRAWPEPKDDFVRELTRRLEILVQRVGLLQHAVMRRARGEQVELKDGLRDLRERALRLQRALEAYRLEDGYAWLHFRFKAEARWEELHRDLNDATERYRRLYPRGPHGDLDRADGIPWSSARRRL